jgi:hypothetical protein
MDSDVEKTENSEVKAKSRGRWKLMAVLAVCAAPLIGSYFTYYVIKPKGGVTNYGTLIDPRAYPIPAMASTTLDGAPKTLDDYKGKWIMLKVGPSECLQDCQDQLFAMRQLRTMQGKGMERIERVWMITDDKPLDTVLMRVEDGTHMLRAPAAAVQQWLPLEQGTADRASDHVYLIDPLGNLMMRFPKGAVSSDIEKVKKVNKDIAKLLKASAIG